MIDTAEVVAQVLSRVRDKQDIEYILRWQERQPETVTLLSAKEVGEMLGMSLRMTHALLEDIRATGVEIGLLIIPKSTGSTYQYSDDDIDTIQDYLFVKSSKRDAMNLRKRTEMP